MCVRVYLMSKFTRLYPTCSLYITYAINRLGFLSLLYERTLCIYLFIFDLIHYAPVHNFSRTIFENDIKLFCYVVWLCLWTIKLVYILLYKTALTNMRPTMSFPTMWYVQPAKAQTSLRLCTVWSKPFLVTWLFHDC